MDAYHGNGEPGTGNRTETAKKAGNWHWGLGTGGGMRINFDDCMKAGLSGRRRRMDARAGKGEVRGT
jgi:hypothetical protein